LQAVQVIRATLATSIIIITNRTPNTLATRVVSTYERTKLANLPPDRSGVSPRHRSGEGKQKSRWEDTHHVKQQHHNSVVNCLAMPIFYQIVRAISANCIAKRNSCAWNGCTSFYNVIKSNLRCIHHSRSLAAERSCSR